MNPAAAESRTNLIAVNLFGKSFFAEVSSVLVSVEWRFSVCFPIWGRSVNSAVVVIPVESAVLVESATAVFKIEVGEEF